jgi:hypothetical protein
VRNWNRQDRGDGQAGQDDAFWEGQLKPRQPRLALATRITSEHSATQQRSNAAATAAAGPGILGENACHGGAKPPQSSKLRRRAQRSPQCHVGCVCAGTAPSARMLPGMGYRYYVVLSTYQGMCRSDPHFSPVEASKHQSGLVETAYTQRIQVSIFVSLTKPGRTTSLSVTSSLSTCKYNLEPKVGVLSTRHPEAQHRPTRPSTTARVRQRRGGVKRPFGGRGTAQPTK